MAVFIIPARGGSVGIPNKNLQPLRDRPLVQWTIDSALAADCGTVFVTTDSPEIAQVAQEAGVQAIPRPAHLAEGHVHSIYALLHAIESLAVPDDEIVFMLLPTSPFRKTVRYEQALLCAATTGAPAVGIVRTCPYHSLRVKQDGLIAPLLKDDVLNLQRQDTEQLFKVAGGLYAAPAKFLTAYKTFHYNSSYIEISPVEAIDIDTPDDLDLARLIAVSYSPV